MKKQKINYKLQVFANKRYAKITAKREISYEIKLASKLALDELCFRWNKSRLEDEINKSIDTNDKEAFILLSKDYQPYTWE